MYVKILPCYLGIARENPALGPSKSALGPRAYPLGQGVHFLPEGIMFKAPVLSFPEKITPSHCSTHTFFIRGPQKTSFSFIVAGEAGGRGREGKVDGHWPLQWTGQGREGGHCTCIHLQSRVGAGCTQQKTWVTYSQQYESHLCSSQGPKSLRFDSKFVIVWLISMHEDFM